MRILLLEDNLSFAETLITILEFRGHQVVHTVSVPLAIRAFKLGGFDVVITDLHLKGEGEDNGSGFSLIKEIRNKLKSNVVVIMTTGLELVAKADAMKRGVDLFYYKPLQVSYDVFIASMEDLVLERRKTQA